jgi:PqqD family protein of HPr-rel-A system
VCEPAYEPRTWRLLEPADLAWRCWDGEYIVFHPFSGMTHYLDATAGAVLALLLEGPAAIPDLAAELAGMADTPDINILGNAVQQVLRRFDDIGLAEAVA